ncbi:MAG: hypothetical protein U5R14_02410 [Gemmatimonadota bacterium]|nr:hypothetical protein [Gemmatimonadota bacterium]
MRDVTAVQLRSLMSGLGLMRSELVVVEFIREGRGRRGGVRV